MNNNLEKRAEQNIPSTPDPESVERAGEDEKEIIDLSPDDFVEIKLDDLEDLTDFIIEEGVKELKDIEESSGLSEAEIQEAKKELNFRERMKNIYNRARDLMEQAKESILGIWPRQPIKTGEVFAPEEELARLRKLPTSERRKALNEFKEKLAYQKKGMALMQEAIIVEIRKDPDTVIELYYKVNEFGERYGFTSEQKQVAKQIIEQYREKHANVRKIRQEHPDDRDLFKELFGRSPKGEVQIIEGPMTLYVRCHTLEDFVYIATYGFLENREPTEEEMKFFGMAEGGMVVPSLIRGLENTTLVENSKGRFFGQELKAVLKHEEQHAIKRFFKEKNLKFDAEKTLRDLINEKTKELAMYRYFQYLREDEYRIDSLAKDEILAYNKQGFPPEQILRLLTTNKAEGGLYDYFESFKDLIVAEIKALTDELDEDSKNLVTRVVENIFKKDFHQLIADGINAVTMLKNSGYSVDQSIAVLLQEPLTNWKRAVSRLLKTKAGRARR